jgi:hypothetical protein
MPLVAAAEQASDAGVNNGETLLGAEHASDAGAVRSEKLLDVTAAEPTPLSAKRVGASEGAKADATVSASWPEAAEAAERLQWEEFVEALFAVIHALHLDPPPPDTVAKLGYGLVDSSRHVIDTHSFHPLFKSSLLELHGIL